MLYLAEVQKQKGSLLTGAGKTELKLLACQRTDQSWSTVSEDVIAAEEASKLNDGALILVEMTPQRQVQRIQEAGRPLVNILQNFSRQLEKIKVKEEEIDQWKESLTFQAQELNRRELEIETRLEQLENMEDEFQRLETQKQVVETSCAEMEKLREEVERNRQELEGAWEHLRGEQRRLEESQANLQQGKMLDEQQSRLVNELLDRLSGNVAPTETVREHLQLALEMLEKQQSLLNSHWEKLEQQKIAVGEQQAEVDRLSQVLPERQNEWQQAQDSLEQQIAQLRMNTVSLNCKQEYAYQLKKQLRHQEELYQQIQFLAAMSGDGFTSQEVDVAALEKMPLEELHKIVQDLQGKLNIDFNFVKEQEQEFKDKQETIEELQRKINQTSKTERSALEVELADEKDHYQMLNETLVGQRRHLLDCRGLLKQHKAVLLNRQEQVYAYLQEDKLDFNSILLQLEKQRQRQSEALQNLEREIEQIQASIEQTQEIIEQQTQQQQTKRQELQMMEQDLLSLRTATAECSGRVNLYQEALQPIQDSLDGLRQKLQGITEVQQTGDDQLQVINQIRQVFVDLISQPQLAAN
ncbi:pilus motility taxis protein HmpF [Chlorogloeopsis sp. ULAP01]|uniref:pilus motility taxis protein HmpF n=1 Tax=Chlorogloeopsis sp. ULAP01 TaxID=3056483 RepID=UPI0025AAA9DF|nr:pilus motility taxis protein HmpF [Chlorogloeopsis sp. ULAP01]MDM9381100.1 pilus motility taxis protein HmpF [Chlorogloeopsis sp. ULAP01]